MRTEEAGWMQVNKPQVAVLGAGMVGVCTALALRERGVEVTLLDRRAPGRETSYGNAGVLARSSLMPLNNPSLWSNLPRLASNRSTSLRYDAGFVLRNFAWVSRFLANARQTQTGETAHALNSLITLSIDTHLRLIAANNLEDLLSDQGWLHLYRDAPGFEAAAPGRRMMRQHGVEIEELQAADLIDIEPALKTIFAKGTWIKGSYSIKDPGGLVKGYARAFAARGGQILSAEVTEMIEDDVSVTLRTSDGTTLTFDQVAVCAGPWSKECLERSGYRVAMAFERGYHRHFDGRMPGGNQPRLNRPIYDTAAGYVLAPMRMGLRLTTGVELADRDAPPAYGQITQAEAAAREAIELGEPIDNEIWLGRRPTFPDSRPAIGLAPQSRRVFLGTGHQHIGFMTGSGTGELLADLMTGRACAIDPHPFRPERYVRRLPQN